MILRQAAPGDAGAIAAIWNREIREGVSTFNAVEKGVAELEALIAERGPALIVAEAADEVNGFATYFQFRGGVGYAHTMELTIHLDEGARGRGVGRALVSALEETARVAGVHSLIAGIGGENAAGVAFHARMGFSQVGRLPQVGRKFDRWMDLVLMQKML